MAETKVPEVIVIVYTTLYRKGGGLFPIVGATLAREKKEAGFQGEIIARAVESKRELLGVFAELKSSNKLIAEFHFVGHSGMYGPMFGAVSFPEQFSPYEWRTLDIPFAPGASAYFHCCRSARWFAPFFARTFNVQTYGFFWYTTFSRSKTRFSMARKPAGTDRLYTIGCKGRKSHGLGASALKLAGLMPAEEMKPFAPEPPSGETSYDKIASLYDEAFADIKVRQDEWAWLSSHLPERDGLSVLDIGCGNGALLNALRPLIGSGVGIDQSQAVIERANRRAANATNLRFQKVDSPSLPFDSDAFDVVISLMSFRYLDWDPLLREVKRVTKPGGIFLIVDMVTVPARASEYYRVVRDKSRAILAKRRNPTFQENLKRLVTHPDWKTMLKYNPIRSEHEMKWYLESRFPGRKMEVLNIGWDSRIVAFDSGSVERCVEAELSYP